MVAFRYVVPELIRMAAQRGDHTYPHANYKPIPEAYGQPVIVPRSLILHTMAGPRSTSPENLWLYMNRGDINGECHVQLGYTSIIQALPFNVRADNNYKANSWTENGVLHGAISVETQDDGSETNVEDDPWNTFQLEHLAGIAAFVHLRYGIPLDRVTDVWTDGGVDGHRAWPEWSLYVGKTCPGEKRWTQIPEVLSLAQEIAYPTPEPAPVPPEADPDMAKIPTVRPRGIADQFALVPIASAEQARRMGIDGQPPIVIDVDVAALQAAVNYVLTPTQNGQ